MSDWMFGIAGSAIWRDGVDAAPSEDRKRAFWDLAVPRFARHQGPAPALPCVVVCRVRAPGQGGRPPGGPLGRAKGLLDALHDDRRAGPRYRDRNAAAPLPDDHPGHVAGLAVEVVAGPARTE